MHPKSSSAPAHAHRPPPAHTAGLDTLLDTAASQFARFGLSGVSMRDIGREIGYTAPLICYHFATKDNLYLEAFSHKIEQTIERIVDRVSERQEAAHRFPALVAALYDLFAADRDLLALVQRDIIDASNGQRPLLSRRQYLHFNAMIRRFAAEFTGADVSDLTTFSVASLVFGYCLLSTVRLSLSGGGAEAMAADRAALVRQAVNLLRGEAAG